MCSAYKLNKQGDNIHPWRTPFLIWNQSVVPCPVLTIASWISKEAGKVVWYYHLMKSFPQFFVIHTVKGFGPYSHLGAERTVFEGVCRTVKTSGLIWPSLCRVCRSHELNTLLVLWLKKIKKNKKIKYSVCPRWLSTWLWTPEMGEFLAVL